MTIDDGRQSEQSGTPPKTYLPLTRRGAAGQAESAAGPTTGPAARTDRKDRPQTDRGAVAPGAWPPAPGAWPPAPGAWPPGLAPGRPLRRAWPNRPLLGFAAGLAAFAGRVGRAAPQTPPPAPAGLAAVAARLAAFAAGLAGRTFDAPPPPDPSSTSPVVVSNVSGRFRLR